MHQKPGYVVLVEAPNPLEAQFIAGALEDEGIPTHVDEDHLADEFAMSQKMMGLQRVRVMVPRDRLVDAQAVLADLPEREAADGDVVPWDQPDGEHEPAPLERDTAPRVHFGWFALLGALTIAFGFLYWQERAINNAGEGENLLRTWKRTDTGYEERWKHNGELHTVTRTSSTDLAFEVDQFNRDGKRVYTVFDRDLNGIWEEIVFYRPTDGTVMYTEHDRDQDGTIEWRVFPVRDGKAWRFHDRDGDGYMEIREQVDAATEAVLLRQEDVGVKGYVTVD